MSTRVVLEYNVFSIFMFIILGKTSTPVVLTPALSVTQECSSEHTTVICEFVYKLSLFASAVPPCMHQLIGDG